MNACIKYKWNMKMNFKKLIIKIVCVIILIINRTKTNCSNILLNEQIYENISVYKISYKTPTGGRNPLQIRFDKIDGFIISLDGKIKHLALFDYGLFWQKIVIKLNIL